MNEATDGRGKMDETNAAEPYDFPACRRPAPAPAAGGMTDAEADAAWEDYLHALAHDE